MLQEKLVDIEKSMDEKLSELDDFVGQLEEQVSV
jgi:hypothetical protein